MIRPEGYRVNLTRSLKPGTHRCTVVTEARARGLAGDRVAVENPLQVDTNPEMMWTELSTKERLDRIEVVVKYAAGNEETHLVNLNR